LLLCVFLCAPSVTDERACVVHRRTLVPDAVAIACCAFDLFDSDKAGVVVR
jgi:hypothetical protein